MDQGLNVEHLVTNTSDSRLRFPDAVCHQRLILIDGVGIFSSFDFFNFSKIAITTVKPVFFACPLFREFRDPDEFAKITGRKYIF